MRSGPLANAHAMPEAHVSSGRSSSLRSSWAALSESVRTRLWPLPIAAIVLAVALGVVLPRIDVLVDGTLPTGVDSAVFNGGAETARAVLSSIAGSLITATSLTFSLTVIALQLASSQASPRVLRLFARDPQVHWTLAAFLGTFAYSLTVLRSVRSETGDIPEFVTRISVTVAFALTLVSVMMLVFFLAHLAAQLRVETMLKEIHAETDRAIDLVGDRNAGAPAYTGEIPSNPRRYPVLARSSGFVTGEDLTRLTHTAAAHGIVIHLRKRVGENVLEGTPLAFYSQGDGDGDARAIDGSIEDAVRSAYAIGYERTASEDVDFGVQQILDIALRALSPAVNDPTTAVDALGHLGAITVRMLAMPQPPRAVRGPDGQLCVVTKTRTTRELVEGSLSPMRHYGAEHPAVVGRFVQVVTEIISASGDDAEVGAALGAQLDALTQQLRAMQSDPASTSAMLALVEETRTELARR